MNRTVEKVIKKATETAIKKSANSVCVFWYHQPKAPANLNKFSKIV